MNEELRATLEAVRSGALSVDEAALRLKKAPFEDLGYAKVDLHRAVRQGAAEVIYGAGKTPAQIAGIAARMRERGVEPAPLMLAYWRDAAQWAKAHPADEDAGMWRVENAAARLAADRLHSMGLPVAIAYAEPEA